VRTPNRQQRRTNLCFKAPRARSHGLAISPRRLALTADDDDLVEVAERIAAELELSPELVDLLSLEPSATTARRVRGH
jgi:hypothetical protein